MERNKGEENKRQKKTNEMRRDKEMKNERKQASFFAVRSR